MDQIYVGSVTGQPDNKVNLNLNRANRHGLIAGATGTGKTVTLRVMAEGLSKLGVPVFMADVKGDLTGVMGGTNAMKIAMVGNLPEFS